MAAQSSVSKGTHKLDQLVSLEHLLNRLKHQERQVPSSSILPYGSELDNLLISCPGQTPLFASPLIKQPVKIQKVNSDLLVGHLSLLK